jgi:acetoin utilization deacetylase AcuC-like enzyme
MTELVADISSKYSASRIVSVLEGGYNLQALARSVESHLGVLSQ